MHTYLILVETNFGEAESITKERLTLSVRTRGK